MRRLKRFVSPQYSSVTSRLFSRHSESFESARLIVRCYYGCLFLIAFLRLSSWSGLLQREGVEPLWPVAWIHFLPSTELRVHLIMTMLITGTLVAAFWPHHRWARTAAFLGLLLADAYRNSFGKIGHSYHVWVLTSFLLVFLPAGWGGARKPDRHTRQQFLTVVWSCQAMLLLTYSMAGLGKAAGAAGQIVQGEVHALAPSALAFHISDLLLKRNSTTLLGPWLIDHYLFAWPAMLLVLYLQFFSFWIAFRPSLHRFWGAALIVVHAGIYLSMGISFYRNVVLIGLLLLASPFRPFAGGWRKAVAQLPLFDTLRRRRTV